VPVDSSQSTVHGKISSRKFNPAGR